PFDETWTFATEEVPSVQPWRPAARSGRLPSAGRAHGSGGIRRGDAPGTEASTFGQDKGRRRPWRQSAGGYSSMEVRVAPLSDHVRAIPVLVAGYATEWPEWYGPDGPGDAVGDLNARVEGEGLPLGLVA